MSKPDFELVVSGLLRRIEKLQNAIEKLGAEFDEFRTEIEELTERRIKYEEGVFRVLEQRLDDMAHEITALRRRVGDNPYKDLHPRRSSQRVPGVTPQKYAQYYTGA